MRNAVRCEMVNGQRVTTWWIRWPQNVSHFIRLLILNSLVWYPQVHFTSINTSTTAVALSSDMTITRISCTLILSISMVNAIRPNSLGNANVELSVLRKGDEVSLKYYGIPYCWSIGGFCSSMEMYACQRESQSLVISEIANWMQAEKKSNDFMFNSLIFASLGTL